MSLLGRLFSRLLFRAPPRAAASEVYPCGPLEKGALVVIRPYADRDHAAVISVWSAGFYEMVGKMTSKMMWSGKAAVGIAAVAVAVGAYTKDARAAVGSALLSVPLAAGACYVTIRYFVSQAIADGIRNDMGDISASWHHPEKGAAFLVAEVEGDVVGCVAISGGQNPPTLHANAKSGNYVFRCVCK